MPNISLTDTASQLAEIQRRQRMAEALAAQGAAPIEVQSYKGIQAPISPFSALAKVLQTYAGARGEKKAREEEKAARQTARDEAKSFFQDLEKTTTPNLAAPTGVPEIINTGVPTAEFTPASGTNAQVAQQAGLNPQQLAEMLKMKNVGPVLAEPTAPAPVAPIPQAPPIDQDMAGAPMVRAMPAPQDNGPARMPMGNAPTIQAPQLYGNEQAPVAVNSPQEKMAMLMQAQMSGNPYLEKIAPEMYGEVKSEAKAKKVFDAIGDVSKEYGADPRIMAGIVAANDPNAGIDYLMKLGASNAAAKQEMQKLIYTTTERAEEKALDRQSREEDRQAQREMTFAIAKMSNDTRRDIAAAMQTKLRDVPVAIQKAYVTNTSAIEGMKNAKKLVESHKDSFGLNFQLGNAVNQRIDPKGVDARAAIANISSGIIHNRAGAAVPIAEAKWLTPFIPLITDNSDTVIKKLNGLMTQLENENNLLASGYSEDSNYKPLGGSGNTRLKLNPKTGELEPA
jgi:hypothetical protein